MKDDFYNVTVLVRSSVLTLADDSVWNSVRNKHAE